ncbi:efflux RND transporter periplasmic adaptor subunit [Dyella subtropica]|uniref:efflux RND transporter periplasmic adaptor subunit n=1 Tax=Dyella subtropica TaxID=2992127 RepID=UPI00225371C7|nr:efflux RND transporter periplasmic adaptor subunit [Dyella subtropica]
MTRTPRAVLGGRGARILAFKAATLGATFSPLLLASTALHAGVAYDCLIEPMQTVELGAPVSGVLDHVLVKRGDRVGRNQVLASLESHAEQAAADLAHYKSQLAGPTQLAASKIEFSQRKFTRRRDMAAEKLMSHQDSDDAEAEFKQAQAELVVAKENREQARLEYVQQSSQLNLRTIRSPFDGVVVDQMMWPGEIFEPNATKHAVLKVAQLNPLHVRVVMPMRAFGVPKLGMAATVVSEIQPEQPYAAKITSVDRIVDAASGTFVVFMDLPNPKLDLPSGVKCKATLGP